MVPPCSRAGVCRISLVVTLARGRLFGKVFSSRSVKSLPRAAAHPKSVIFCTSENLKTKLKSSNLQTTLLLRTENFKFLIWNGGDPFLRQSHGSGQPPVASTFAPTR
jgi:hypothetical protein